MGLDFTMRTGRLQTPTLANIWKALEHNLDTSLNSGTDLSERLQKQYIPVSSDSPLYRLISVNDDADDLDTEASYDGDSVITPIIENNVDSNNLHFLTRGPVNHRGMSVPNLESEGLDQHLPLPRVVQSTSNLFPQSTETNNTGNSATRPIPENTSTSESLNPRQSSVEQEMGSRATQSTMINRSISFSSASKSKKKGKQTWMEEYAHIDIEWSMQAMDVLYNASFYDYIRDERNVDLSAIRLSRIIKEYKPRQVANALLWMIQGWSVENTSKLLRVVFSDWLPDLAGYLQLIRCVFSLISRSWPKTPQCSLCVAYLLMAEPAGSSALFLRSLTQGWSRKESIDLITYLDAALKWNTTYLQEVMTIYATSLSLDEPKFSQFPREKVCLELNGASQKLV